MRRQPDSRCGGLLHRPEAMVSAGDRGAGDGQGYCCGAAAWRCDLLAEDIWRASLAHLLMSVSARIAAGERTAQPPSEIARTAAAVATAMAVAGALARAARDPDALGAAAGGAEEYPDSMLLLLTALQGLGWLFREGLPVRWRPPARPSRARTMLTHASPAELFPGWLAV